MNKGKMLYEGKAKRVYEIEGNDDCFLISYKDDATAFNGLKKGQIDGKGVINNRTANFIFKKLEEENGIETHLVEEISDRETIVKKVEIVPLEIIVRNIAAGSFSKKFGVEEGTAKVLEDEGMDVTVVNKIHEDRVNNTSKLIESGVVKYVISTSSKGRIPTRDSVKIRRKAIDYAVPCLTSIDTANALAESLLSHYSEENTRLVDINSIYV